MDRDQARVCVDGARVARLGTLSKTGRVDLVPITFTVVDDVLVTAVDHKPKTTTHLKRLENVRANPEVSVLVDEYDDIDWAALWWVRLRGQAEVIEDGDRYDRAIDALVEKYPQYEGTRPAGPAIIVHLVGWQWWSASP
jgi:PPOX class probable F420-dependent enzyme